MSSLNHSHWLSILENNIRDKDFSEAIELSKYFPDIIQKQKLVRLATFLQKGIVVEETELEEIFSILSKKFQFSFKVITPILLKNKNHAEYSKLIIDNTLKFLIKSEQDVLNFLSDCLLEKELQSSYALLKVINTLESKYSNEDYQKEYIQLGCILCQLSDSELFSQGKKILLQIEDIKKKEQIVSDNLLPTILSKPLLIDSIIDLILELSPTFLNVCIAKLIEYDRIRSNDNFIQKAFSLLILNNALISSDLVRFYNTIFNTNHKFPKKVLPHIHKLIENDAVGELIVLLEHQVKKSYSPLWGYELGIDDYKKIFSKLVEKKYDLVAFQKILFVLSKKMNEDDFAILFLETFPNIKTFFDADFTKKTNEKIEFIFLKYFLVKKLEWFNIDSFIFYAKKRLTQDNAKDLFKKWIHNKDSPIISITLIELLLEFRPKIEGKFISNLNSDIREELILSFKNIDKLFLVVQFDSDKTKSYFYLQNYEVLKSLKRFNAHKIKIKQEINKRINPRQEADLFHYILENEFNKTLFTITNLYLTSETLINLIKKLLKHRNRVYSNEKAKIISRIAQIAEFFIEYYDKNEHRNNFIRLGKLLCLDENTFNTGQTVFIKLNLKQAEKKKIIYEFLFLLIPQKVSYLNSIINLILLLDGELTETCIEKLIEYDREAIHDDFINKAFLLLLESQFPRWRIAFFYKVIFNKNQKFPRNPIPHIHKMIEHDIVQELILLLEKQDFKLEQYFNIYIRMEYRQYNFALFRKNLYKIIANAKSNKHSEINSLHLKKITLLYLNTFWSFNELNKELAAHISFNQKIEFLCFIIDELSQMKWFNIGIMEDIIKTMSTESQIKIFFWYIIDIDSENMLPIYEVVLELFKNRNYLLDINKLIQLDLLKKPYEYSFTYLILPTLQLHKFYIIKPFIIEYEKHLLLYWLLDFYQTFCKYFNKDYLKLYSHIFEEKIIPIHKILVKSVRTHFQPDLYLESVEYFNNMFFDFSRERLQEYAYTLNYCVKRDKERYLKPINLLLENFFIQRKELSISDKKFIKKTVEGLKFQVPILNKNEILTYYSKEFNSIIVFLKEYYFYTFSDHYINTQNIWENFFDFILYITRTYKQRRLKNIEEHYSELSESKYHAKPMLRKGWLGWRAKDSAGRDRNKGDKINTYTKIHFPKKCTKERKEKLIIQLTQKQFETSRIKKKLTFLKSKQEIEIHIQITCPAFFVKTTTGILILNNDGNSNVLIFELIPDDIGEQKLEIELYFLGKRIGHYALTTKVNSPPLSYGFALGATQAMQSATSPTFQLREHEIRQNKTKARTLHINWDKKDGSLEFTVYSYQKQEQGSTYKQVGVLQNNSIEAYLKDLNAHLSQMVIQGSPSDERWNNIVFTLESMGISLYKIIIPEKLQKIIKNWENDSTLLIATNEQWIPWELLNDDNDFWGKRFKLARYPRIENREVSSNSETDESNIRIRSLLNVIGGKIPNSNKIETLFQKYSRKIKIRTLQKEGISKFSRAARNKDVIQCTCHGWLNPYLLQISDTKTSFENLTIENIKRLELKPNSLVFINACSSSVSAFTFGKFSNFAWEFYKKGINNYIGTLGKVPTKYAVAFAESLYKHLLDNKTSTIGEALQKAKADAEQNRNIFWLLYTLYGDPDQVFYI